MTIHDETPALLRVLHNLMTIVGKAEDVQMLPPQLMRAATDEDGRGGMEVEGEGMHCLLPPRSCEEGEDVEEEVRVSEWVGVEGEEDDMVVGLSLGYETNDGGWSGEAGGRGGGWRRVGIRGKKRWQRGGGGSHRRRWRQRSREVERGRGRRRREGRDVGKSGQRESWSSSGRGRGGSQEGRRGSRGGGGFGGRSWSRRRGRGVRR